MTDTGHAVSEDGLREQSGYALPIVLVFLGIVAAFSARFVGEARLELDMQRTMRDRARLEAVAREVAIGFDPAWMNGSGESSASFFCAASFYSVSLVISQQDGLIELNTAPGRDIAAALGAIGIPPPAANEIAAEIVRFRSYDPHVRFEAAQDGIVGGPKRGPFEAVEELADFEALAPVDSSRLRQVLTVRKWAGGAMANDIAGAYSVEIRAVSGNGRVAASFGAVLSLDPASPPARLVDVFEPGAAINSPAPGALPCPASLARLVSRLAETAERGR
jgi:hypothetical protein